MTTFAEGTPANVGEQQYAMPPAIGVDWEKLVTQQREAGVPNYLAYEGPYLMGVRAVKGPNEQMPLNAKFVEDLVHYVGTDALTFADVQLPEEAEL